MKTKLLICLPYSFPRGHISHQHLNWSSSDLAQTVTWTLWVSLGDWRSMRPYDHPLLTISLYTLRDMLKILPNIYFDWRKIFDFIALSASEAPWLCWFWASGDGGDDVMWWVFYQSLHSRTVKDYFNHLLFCRSFPWLILYSNSYYYYCYYNLIIIVIRWKIFICF